jgi:hypothetical protein
MVCRFGNFTENSFNSKLTSTSHDRLIVNAIDFGHVHISVDQVESIDDFKAQAMLLKEQIYSMMGIFQPPFHYSALTELCEALLQNLKTYVV